MQSQRLECPSCGADLLLQSLAPGAKADGRYLAAIPGSAGQSLQIFRLPKEVAEKQQKGDCP